MRAGMEALSITEERLTELGLPNFSAPFDVSCQNHGGGGSAMLQQWDADTQTWSLITDWIEADRELIGELAAEDAAVYAQENNITPGCL